MRDFWQKIKCKYLNRHHAIWFINKPGNHEILACRYCGKVFVQRSTSPPCVTLTLPDANDREDDLDSNYPTVH